MEKLRSITEFKKRAKSVLWRQGKGTERKEYNKWKDKVEDLKAGASYTEAQAIVQASKDYACLRPLFREYDIRGHDPNPGSHNGIEYHGESSEVLNEEKEQTHRENLKWALLAAGERKRTGKAPEITPNNAAYYLYEQAIEDPKDFLAKYTQIEAKGDGDEEDRRLMQRSGKRRIAEINEMLQVIENPDTEEYEDEGDL